MDEKAEDRGADAGRWADWGDWWVRGWSRQGVDLRRFVVCQVRMAKCEEEAGGDYPQGQIIMTNCVKWLWLDEGREDVKGVRASTRVLRSRTEEPVTSKNCWGWNIGKNGDYRSVSEEGTWNWDDREGGSYQYCEKLGVWADWPREELG